MKKLIVLISSAFLFTTSLFAQDVPASSKWDSPANSGGDDEIEGESEGGGGDGFSVSFGAGIPFSADGKNISNDKPTLGLSLSGNIGIGTATITLRRTPYSPALMDSSLTTREDSSTYFKRYYRNSAVLAGFVGLHSVGENGLGGGLRTGGGVSFIEKNDNLYVIPLWEITVDGEYVFGDKYAAGLSATYSYLFSEERFGTDGFVFIFELILKCKF